MESADPTQVPYILSWGNPAEAATGGAADWSIRFVDPSSEWSIRTGNPYPETGRAPGKDLWTETIMAVDWKTGAQNWFFQTTHHDQLDFDLPHPTMVLRARSTARDPDGRGRQQGRLLYVLNARNGGTVPNFKITETPTYDPSGVGIAQNNLFATQPYPTGASFCMAVVDYSPAGLAKCNFPGDPLIDEYGTGLGNTVVSPTQVTNLSKDCRSSVRRSRLPTARRSISCTAAPEVAAFSATRPRRTARSRTPTTRA